MEITKTYTIERERWQRGEGEDHSQLWSQEENRGCCLGLAMLQDGAAPNAIDDYLTPYDIAERNILPDESAWMVSPHRISCAAILPHQVVNERIGQALMCINDSEELEADERERLLNVIASELGVKFEFVD